MRKSSKKMRLYFTLTPNNVSVPFDYQHRLTGVFNKWLAENNLHDSISLYSLSWLKGGKAVNGSLQFPLGARWFVSFYEEEHAERLVNGALAEPELFCGMRVAEIRQHLAPDFGTRFRFKVASPVLVKGKSEAGAPPHHYLCHEPEADLIMTRTLIHKMDEANKNAGEVRFTDEDKNVRVSFDREFLNPKIKLVSIKGIKHKANICPIIVEGTKEAVKFAWNVGVGNGTGSCFGSLKEK